MKIGEIQSFTELSREQEKSREQLCDMTLKYLTN